MATRRGGDSMNLRTIWSVITVVFVVLVSVSSGGVLVYNWVSEVNADRLVLKIRIDRIEKKQEEAEREERWNRNNRNPRR